MAQEVTNFARFYGILKKSYKFATKELGDEFKEGVVSQFTNGRTTSLREMTRKEYDMMCDKLEGVTAKLVRTAKDVQRKHRSQCLRLMQKLGIDTTDWTRINAFCQDQRIAGKVFSQLSNEELEQLSVKLRSIQRKGGLKPKKEPTPPAQARVEYMMMPIGNEKVKRVMEYIHGIAYRELQGDQYIEFLECIEYEIDKELEEGDWPEPEEDE